MAIPAKLKVTTQDAYNYAANKTFADQQLCMVMALNGKLDENLLAKAVRLTLDMEPVLGCKFVENGMVPFWERRSDLDQIKFCSLEETADPQQALNSFVNQVIHADVDPLVSAKIFRNKGKDLVCVKVSHAACDAGGLKEYVAILSNVYGTLYANRQLVVKPNFGRRDQSQVFEHTKDPKTAAMKGFPTPTWTLPQKSGTEPLHSFAQIPQKQFLKIKKYAQTKNATINDLLLTALYRTLFAINNTAEGKPMMIQVSIDLRRYLPDHKAEAICNLSGALYVALDRKQGETFDGTLGRVAALMSKLKEDCPGVDSAAGLEYLATQGFAGMEKYLEQSAELGRKYQVTFPLLSNFGALSEGSFGGLQIEKAYMTSPVMYPPGFMLGASTFNGEMTLSIGYCGKENIKQVTEFLKAYVEELPK